ARQWNDVPLLVDQEWKIRRSLATGISNERIDEIMAAAVSAGASANKICGAGGGGCMITLCPPRNRTAVERAISGAGGTPMPFRIDTQGLSITSAS
ncbi:MAG: GHMP kinase, partial [Deltaproteobacteria bacterium]|nr:GHMP kinase [Deltaproteobacteria bacterium]